LIRHGSRAPGASFGDRNLTGEWFCDEIDSPSPRFHPGPVVHPKNYHEKFDPELMPYKPSCREKDLLTMGMQQHVQLGNFFRNYFVKETQLLDEKFSIDEVFIRASEEDRALRSGISFVQGMYPPLSPNEVIQIMTDTPAAKLIHPDSKCKELDGISDYFFQTEYFNKTWEELGRKYKDVITQHGIKWEPKAVKKFAAYVTMVDCTNHTLEDWITEDLAQECVKFVSFYNYGPHVVEGPYFGVAGSALFRDMFRMADEFISMQNRHKFILLSSHDTQLVAMLPVLGFKEDAGPPVRAHLVFELWEVNDQIMARFVYNGEPVKVDFLGGKDVFLYSNLKLAMTEKGYLNHCFIPEWPQ
jgi:acid phosphatase